MSVSSFASTNTPLVLSTIASSTSEISLFAHLLWPIEESHWETNNTICDFVSTCMLFPQGQGHHEFGQILKEIYILSAFLNVFVSCY